MRVIFLFLSLVLLSACKKEEKIQEMTPEKTLLKAVDISSFPEIVAANQLYYNELGDEVELPDMLQKAGINTIRLRLWVNPVNSHSGFEEVHAYSQLLKSKGFKIWLSIHYSDTWADPGHQQIPQQWQALDLPVLKDSLLRYTAKVVKEIQPDFVQIGNEINSGFLHPLGNIENNYAQFIDLMNTAIEAVRTYAPQTRIILHYAGIENAAWFFEKVKSLDYDIIGLSYYPMWHGKSLELLQQTIDDLAATFSKKVLIAETSYPFTLHWNDLTNNVLGLSEQLILPTYPATPEGQKQYVRRMLEISYESVGCIGLCYWGAELIAWKGPQATDGSAWENQALFDFNSKALPALKEFAAQ